MTGFGTLDDVTGVEALVGDSAQGRGYIRLFSFPEHEAGVLRDGAQAWDTGGIFDVNVRSRGSVEPLHHAMTLNGFSPFAPVTAWTFGTIAVKEVVENNADGLAIAMMERVSPPLQGFEHVAGQVSYVFNSTQVVPSFAMRGSVEIIEYAGEVLDFSAAAPPDRGWAALRFPCPILQDFLSVRRVADVA